MFRLMRQQQQEEQEEEEEEEEEEKKCKNGSRRLLRPRVLGLGFRVQGLG